MKMKKINFVTSNKGKINTLKRLFKLNDINIEIVPQKLDIVEPQAHTVNEVSKSKALQAYKILNEPVVVEDGGFYIDALGNFPGVYVRYILDTIGVDGIIKLLEGKENRKALFYSCTTFINENGEIFQFENDLTECSHGYIAEERARVSCPHAWSDLWFIYKDSKSGKTWAEISEKKTNKADSEGKGRKNSVRNFVDWLNKNYL